MPIVAGPASGCRAKPNGRWPPGDRMGCGTPGGMGMARAPLPRPGCRWAAEQVWVQADPALVLTDEFANILSGWYQAAAPSQNYFYGYHPTDFYHVQVSAPEDWLVARHQRELAG